MLSHFIKWSSLAVLVAPFRLASLLKARPRFLEISLVLVEPKTYLVISDFQART